MAGPSDISTILSNAGRIEKVNQSPFAHGEAARQVLTEDEVRERMRRSREVNEAKEGQDIRAKERQQRKDAQARQRRKQQQQKEAQAQQAEEKEESIHLIDLVV